MRHTDSNATTLKLLLAFFAIYVIWGSTYLAIRFAVEGLPPLLMMGARHLIAGALLLGLLLLRGEKSPGRMAWRAALLGGALQFLGGHGLLAWAEVRVSSGLAALLVAAEPLVMVVLARLAGQERLSLRTVGALGLGMIGVALLFETGVRQGSALAAAAVLVAALFWSLGAIYARGVRTGTSTVMFAAMQMLVGGILLLAVGGAAGERVHAAEVSLRSVAALVYLIIFGSLVAFSAYTWLMKVTTAARVTTHCYVNPIVAVFLGWALAGERVTTTMLVGTAIVIASVVLVTLSKREERLVPAEMAAD
jgi:drug/metabolite transporter (DMT)-like permease